MTPRVDTIRERRFVLVWRVVLPVLVAAALVALAVANIAVRATWNEVEDGVLWTAVSDEVVARDVAQGTPAEHAGIHPGDTLLAIDGRAITSPHDVVAAMHRGREGTNLTYTIIRAGSQQIAHVPLAPVPQGSRVLYYLLASVAIFSLLDG